MLIILPFSAGIYGWNIKKNVIFRLYILALTGALGMLMCVRKSFCLLVTKTPLSIIRMGGMTRKSLTAHFPWAGGDQGPVGAAHPALLCSSPC